MSRQLPQTLLAGDTFLVVFDTNKYSTDDGYSVALKLTGPSGAPQKYTYSANANTTSTSLFDIKVSPAATANLATGTYAYAVVANDSVDSYTVEAGSICVEARADLITNSDLRSHALKVYEAICAVIEGRATQDQQSYTIAGRTLTRIPIADLLALKNHYKDLVKSEQNTSQKKVRIQFSSPA